MNKDLHIEKAALLADKPGAENLATDRAKKFVADALGSKEEDSSKVHNFFVRKPVYAWGGVALALAACVAAAIVVFRPAAGDNSILPGYGIPGQLHEGQSIHAGTDVVDTTSTETSDTLAIESIILPE